MKTPLRHFVQTLALSLYYRATRNHISEKSELQAIKKETIGRGGGSANKAAAGMRGSLYYKSCTFWEQ
jgi:hypothetical protein